MMLDSSHCCLLDCRWNVKISDWEFERIRERQAASRRGYFATSEKNDSTSRPIYESWQLAWIAPELLRHETVVPNKKTDIYSFAILLVEIFTRQRPYSELKAAQTGLDEKIVEKIKLLLHFYRLLFYVKRRCALIRMSAAINVFIFISWKLLELAASQFTTIGLVRNKIDVTGFLFPQTGNRVSCGNSSLQLAISQ